MPDNSILDVRNLTVRYRGRDADATVHAIDQVSFSLERGKVLALVGESGAGKTTAGMSILRLLPQEGEILSGEVYFEGSDLLRMPEHDLRDLRGRRIAMIFQDPVAGLNPVISVGDQVAEMLTSHMPISKKDAKREALKILAGVGLADPDRVAKAFPFQLSGGMCQRVMIGIATALDPEVLIADEPTSALDVTVQAQILYQLNRLRQDRGTAILLITHNFGVVAQMADDVAVLYGGRIVETGDVEEMHDRPYHPYTHALLDTLPRLDETRGQLRAIPGTPPELSGPPEHCPFMARCPKVMTVCREDPAPPLDERNGSAHAVACYNPVWQADE